MTIITIPTALYLRITRRYFDVIAVVRGGRIQSLVRNGDQVAFPLPFFGRGSSLNLGC
jgi:hypothetical protein